MTKEKRETIVMIGQYLSGKIQVRTGLDYEIVERAVYNSLNDLLIELNPDCIEFPNGTTFDLSFKI